MTRIVAAIAACLLTVSAALAVDQPALTAKESASLAAVLKNAKPATVTIACPGPWCRGLANDVAKVFRAAKWKVERMNRGGLGIDGVAGIRVHPCDDESAKAARSILAGRKPHEVIVEKCAGDSRDIFLILGLPN